MPTHLLVLVPSLVLLAADVPRAAAFSALAPAAARESQVESGALRTDRLSPGQLRVWTRIVAVVRAQDETGRPRHPTLRRLWDDVDATGHVVHVELSGGKGTPSYLAGRFAVTKVDPTGTSHEAVLVLNLRGIDRVSTEPPAARPDGFVPFKDLRRFERYAELLGHELAHAVWLLGDPERARVGQWLETEREARARAYLGTATRGPADALRTQMAELDRLAAEVERPADEAERTIWRELRAGQRPR